MSYSSTLKDFTELASYSDENKTMDCNLRDATLVDLTEAFGTLFVGLKTTDQTVPPQAKYNATIISVFEKHNFFGFVSGLLKQLCNFYGSNFAFCTVNVPLGKFPRPSREQFQESKHLYVFDNNMNLCLKEVYPIEIIRAVRLYLRNLLFRFFKTYDVDESYTTKDGKTDYTCDPSKATFRSNGRTYASDDFCSFIEYLINANRYFKQLTLELSEFSEPLRTAAKTAKAERNQYSQQKAQHYSLQKTFKNVDSTTNGSTHAKVQSDAKVESPVLENDGDIKLVSKKKHSPPQKNHERFRAKRS